MPLLEQTTDPISHSLPYAIVTHSSGRSVTDAKTERLVIRMSPGDKRLVERAAAADELEVSTWARRVIVQTAKRRDAKDRGGDDA